MLKETLPMNPREQTSTSAEDDGASWAKLMDDDTFGIDRDIENLVRLLRSRHGYTRARASDELVKRLTLATDTPSATDAAPGGP